VSSTPPGRRGAEQPHNVAAAIAEVSERATLLVREEIELAKAEVSEKATKLIKGAVVGVAAGIFFMTALFFALIGCAWLLYYFLPGGDFTYFWGFFAMAVILVVLGVIAGLIAARAVKRGSPPVPSLAFEEARKIRETVSAPSAGRPADGSLASSASFAAAPTADFTPSAVADVPVASPLAADSDVVVDQGAVFTDADVVDQGATEADAPTDEAPAADASPDAPAGASDAPSSTPEDEG
jgi:uncharacterized membrane protein YqjE